MTKKKTKKMVLSKAWAKKTIAACFAALSDPEKDNLRYHAKKRTRIACGKDALQFTTKDGRA